MTSRRWLIDTTVLALGAGVFLAASISSTVSYARALGVPFFDWQFYSAAVVRWMSGQPIYPGNRISTLGAAAGSSYAYPPASVPLMAPFASWPVGAFAWEVVIVGTLLLGVWAVVRSHWARPRLAFGIVLVVFAMTEGVTQGIAMGNVNIATAGAVGLVWSRPTTRTWLPAALSVLKVFPLALAAPFRMTIIRAAALAAGICVITLPLVGLAAWDSYATGLAATTPLCNDPRWDNYSLGCVVLPFGGVVAAKVVGIGAAGLLLAFAIWRGPSLAGRSAAALAIIAPATEVHAHYVAIILMVGLLAAADVSARVERRTGSLSRGPGA